MSVCIEWHGSVNRDGYGIVPVRPYGRLYRRWTAAIAESFRGRTERPWLDRPVVLVDDPDDSVDTYSWIEATDEITAANAAERFRAHVGDDMVDGGYEGEKRRKPLAVTGPFWHIPLDPRDDSETPIPLDMLVEDYYLCERVYWTKIALPTSNAVPLWKIEWEPHA